MAATASSALGDAFLSVFDPSKSGASSLVYSTYLGGNKSDAGYAVAIDKAGHAVVTGSTTSSGFPSANPIQAYGGGQAAFVTTIDATQSGTASLVDGTFLGVANDSAAGAASLSMHKETFTSPAQRCRRLRHDRRRARPMPAVPTPSSSSSPPPADRPIWR